jgi:hypothetical protein
MGSLGWGRFRLPGRRLVENWLVLPVGKRQGVNADDAGRQLTIEFKTKYAGWPINNLTNFVKSIYAE